MRTLITLVVVVAISLPAASLGAQTGSGSDVTGPVGGSLSGGAFVPLPSGTGGGTGGGPGGGTRSSTGRGAGVGGTQTFSASVIAAVNVALSNMSSVSGSIASPITNSNVTLPAAVFDLVHGQSPQAVAAVGAALGSAGLPLAESNAAVRSMANVLSAGMGNPAAIVTAAHAFNALVAAMTPSQLANPPAAFLAMHAILSPLAAALSSR